MATVDKKEELRQAAIDMLPDSILSLAYVEHQLDLTGTAVLMMADMFKDQMTEEQMKVIEMLREVLKHSSIDFENIKDVLQSYKIPKTIESKSNTRSIQEQYLLAQIREGVFG